jgi:phenylacetate-CoA ligase
MSSHSLDRNQALSKILTHAARFSPYYHDQTWAKKLRAGKRVHFFQDIPVTKNSVVKTQTERFFSERAEQEDGKTITKYTSGSTGEPTQIRKTMLHFQVNYMESKRLACGWGINSHSRSMSVEPPDESNPTGHVSETTHVNGSVHFSHFGNEFSSVLDCLVNARVTRFNSITSVFYHAMALARERGQSPGLSLAITVGEVTNLQVRDELESYFGFRIFDTYGAVESGTIAARCALCGDYHIADRHLLAELLKDDGSPAQPGEMGKLFVTPLFNTAMPLLRFEIGDFAVVGTRTTCSRSPFALSRILGRERQMFRLKDGRMGSPGFNSSEMFKLGVRQYKLVQTALDKIELRYIPVNPENELKQEIAQSLIDLYLDTSLRVNPIIVSELPRLANGKYFEHERLLN